MLLQQFINGITIGSTYALVAIGFTMIFGVLELTNFSNSSLYMFGAYMTWLLYGVGMNFFVAFALSIALTGLLGFSIDRFALRLLRKRHAPKLSGLITTLGMSMVIDNAIMVFCGTDSKSFENHLDFGKVYIGNAIISWTQIIILIVGFSLMIALSILVYRTKIGKAMTAIAQNQDAAKLMGINTDGTVAWTFAIGSGLAAVGAVLYSASYPLIDPYMGSMLGLKAFVAAVLGGIGSIPGAMIGGLIMGIAESLTKGYIDSTVADAVVFGILIIVLLFKPSGIMGKNVREKV